MNFRVSEQKINRFTRNLGTLLQAGVPLVKGLDVLAKQETSKSFQNLLFKICYDVHIGNSLSGALQKYPAIFDVLYINLLKSGEKSGSTAQALTRIAVFKERKTKLKNKLKSAMMYPMIVLSTTFMLLFLLFAFVIPKFQFIYIDALKEAPLPPLTNILLAISHGIQHNYLTIFFAFVILIASIAFLLKSRKGKEFLDNLTIKTPFLKSVILKSNLALFTRTLSTLLSSGIPIIEALIIARSTLSNCILQKSIIEAQKGIRAGNTIAQSFHFQKNIPSIVSNMIEVGEETGTLPAILFQIADAYEDELEQSLTRFTSNLEPLLIVFIALIVGTAVIALFLPIITLMDNLTFF